MDEFLAKYDLEKSSILEDRKMRQSIPCISGIYFLIKDDEIVYVGRSGNIFSRIFTHEHYKDFDSYSYIECSENLDSMELLEAHFFLKFLPAQNYTLPRNNYYISLAQIKKKLNASGYDLRKFIKQRNIKPVVGKFYRISDFRLFSKQSKSRQDAGLKKHN